MAQSGGRRGGRIDWLADPSAIVAAELAFDRIAVEKGQGAALVQVAAKDAVLFRPGPVFADKWLKKQDVVSVPLRWQTRELFMACDGSVAVSTGLWLRPGAEPQQGGGWYTNIWRREKKGYRLILNDEGALATAEAARADDDLEAMAAHVATCPKRARRSMGGAPPAQQPDASPAIAPLDPAQPLPASRDDRSEDGTLRWRWSVEPGGAHRLEAWMASDTGEVAILPDHAGPAAH